MTANKLYLIKIALSHFVAMVRGASRWTLPHFEEGKKTCLGGTKSELDGRAGSCGKTSFLGV